MERRITNKVETHQIAFKDAIHEWLKNNECHIKNNSDEDRTSEFLKFVFDHEALSFTKEDFQKRKRVKNVVSHFERCTAKKANGEQCTRRKIEGSCFCGTHVKGTPHGVSEGGAAETSNVNKIEVWVEEIKGINYYIDSNNNVYRAEDIVENKPAPSVIAKWELDNGIYTIPAFNV